MCWRCRVPQPSLLLWAAMQLSLDMKAHTGTEDAREHLAECHYPRGGGLQVLITVLRGEVFGSCVEEYVADGGSPKHWGYRQRKFER